ncbi:MAG: winged helix-turn-helix transcriptional regulator [Promethearchaeota archaeon]
MTENKQLKKLTIFFLFKLTFIVFSIVILSVTLYQIIQLSDYYFGPIEEITLSIILISIIIAIIALLSIFEVLTVKEYRGYFIRKPFIKKGKSFLTLKDIFENENRLNILREILNNPGVHQNELLRNCNLQKGQLQWHLKVLLKYHIIKKEKSGQYNIYFPITASIEVINTFKSLPVKSETTNKVFEIIQNNPGISSSEIANIINLARNTVKYHIDKLIENKLIYFQEKGRIRELYPKVASNDT